MQKYRFNFTLPLTIAFLITFSILLKLGFWQLERADHKKNLNESLFDKASKTEKSIQPMSSLFDQALHIYGDIVALGIIEKLKINK